MIPLEPLLAPFIQAPLSPDQLRKLQIFLDLLLKWNAKISLTAVRTPEEIVRRHFGESLFTGEHLQSAPGSEVADLGTGAGFPGLPIAILRPDWKLVLIESQHKKTTFLREAIRTLGITNASIHAGRAENLKASKSQIVTMRAVEKFDSALPVAASLVAPGGQLALLIGIAQLDAARQILPDLEWREPIAVPESLQRVLLVGVSGRQTHTIGNA
ncbi:MAG: 16S rRNA (guanine(527)-N(7))-methyltransferase RsmG [Terriglobales bacterium]